jgi:peptidoglycan/xylan/chitin deacetylase (PgdA/CDA1 family)
MSIRKNLFSIINLFGINAFFRLVNKSKDICLMYHGIVPDDYPIESWLLVKASQFKKQMKYLKQYWEIVHLETYMSKKFHTTKPKAIITFDDGYQNNYSVAYPILRELNLPATIYVVTDFIDSKDLFWFDKVIYSIQKNRLTSLDLMTVHHGLKNYSFSSIRKQRWDDIETVLTNIKALGPEEAEEIAQFILEFVNPDSKHLNFIMPLTRKQIIEMSKSGLIEIGAHTTHHEILTALPLSKAEQTITRSMDAINEILGKYPTHFCYPNGNYSGKILALMQRYNFASAMTVRNDFINPRNFINHEIPRLPIGSFDSINFFKSQVSGLDGFVKKIKRIVKVQ